MTYFPGLEIQALPRFDLIHINCYLWSAGPGAAMSFTGRGASRLPCWSASPDLATGCASAQGRCDELHAGSRCEATIPYGAVLEEARETMDTVS